MKMTKASAKTLPHSDQKLLVLGRRLSNLRAEQIKASCHALECEDALTAANARVDAISDEMDEVYQQILHLTPVTPEGQRALALAIVQKSANTNAVDSPESEFEIGVAALLSSLGADQRAA